MKYESYKIYKLTLKIVANEGISRKSFYFDTFEDAKMYGNKYRQDHAGVSIQRIKEINVYKRS